MGIQPSTATAYPISALIPDWQPPTTPRHRVVPREMLSALREAAASGASLRELAREVGVSYESIRVALRRE